MRSHVPALCLAATASLSACSEAGHTPEPPTTVRDSAGVEIVEVQVARWPGEPWRVSADPIVDLGTIDGPAELQFFRVADLGQFSDGRIVVADAGTLEVRVYAATGEHLWSVGGEGEGPGEFSSLFSARVRADTIFAHDFMNGRVTVFDDRGTLIRTVALDRSDGRPQDVWPVSSGFLALRLDFTAEITDEHGYQRRVARYRYFGQDGSARPSFAELAGQETISSSVEVDGGVAMSMTTPVMANRQQQTAVHGRLVAGITDHWELRVYDGEGVLERLIRDPSRNVPLARSEWQTALEERLDRADTPEVRRNIAEIAELRPPPATRPAFGRFVPDAEGYVWLAPYRPAPGEPAPFTVADPAGAILGDVMLPAGFVPRAIGPDYVLGTWRDGFDVTHVRAYRLDR